MRGAPRRFDHDEAIRRHAAGDSLYALAREFGVSDRAVKLAVDPEERERDRRRTSDRLREARVPCGTAGCNTLVWPHTTVTGLCRECISRAQRDAAPHGTENKYRHGCRCSTCRQAATDAKRRRREATRVPCSHGCGTMVDGINRSNPEKPPECYSCAMARVRRERRTRSAA